MKETRKDTLLMTRGDVLSAWDEDVQGAIDAVEGAFLSYASGDVILPEKASQVFDEAIQSRINCMPSTVRSLRRSGVKWVSVFPENPEKYNLPNVGGALVLSEIEAGSVIGVMDAAALTAIRTAAVDALASRYFAKPGSCSVSIIGTGEQAEFHARLLAPAGSGKTIRLCGRKPEHTKSLSQRLASMGIAVVDFGTALSEAVRDSDIIVTATSGQEPVLKADWIKKGSLYCHVAGWEDEYAVVEKADMIVCDDWASLKHRGSPTLARMYERGLLGDEDIHANLSEILLGSRKARENDDQFIYFNAIGLSFVDVAVGDWLLEKAREKGIGTSFDFSA